MNSSTLNISGVEKIAYLQDVIKIVSKMKKLSSSLIALLFVVNVCAQTISPDNQKLIESFVKNNIDVQLADIDQTAVSKVFSGTFYKINIGFVEPGSGVSGCGSDNYINVNGSDVNMIEPVHMDLECPVLMSLIRKDYLLKDDNAAKLFEAALNTLYPLEEEEIQNARHIHRDSQWIFLRGKFFDDFTAFIVTAGPDGAVTKIELELAFAVN